MCRSIKTLRDDEIPATPDEIRAAALQFVRKVSGYRAPSRANREAFDAAVAEIAGSTERLLDNLVSPARISAPYLLSKRWIVRHLLALVVVATCLGMATWQVSRLQDRKADNAQLIAQSKLPERPLEEVVASGDASYRRVTASGSYDTANEVILQSRSFKERPGNHLLTPLKVDGGTAVIVDRGWVPIEIGEPADPKATPPTGEVEVTGVLLPSEDEGLFGISNPPPGRVKAISRIDLDRLAQQLPYEVPGLYLRLEKQSPAGGALPEPVPIPPPDEGPHFDYAVQWCLFALLSIVIYLALIRKESRRMKGGPDSPEEEPAKAETTG